MENSEIGDSRLKTDLASIENALEGITSLNAFEHRFDTSKVNDYKKHYGLIAQEVEKEFPHLVEEKFRVKNDPKLYKTIDHNQLVAVMVDAIKQLNEKIDKMQEEINNCNHG